MQVCTLCHRELHERARDAGADMRKQATVLHRLATAMRARDALFVELGKSMCREADEITDLIAGFDEDWPNWRQLPEAK